MESIRLIRICACTVAENETVFIGLQNPEFPIVNNNNSMELPNSDLKYVYLLPEDDQIWLRGWMPVLCELFRIINGYVIYLFVCSLLCFVTNCSTISADYLS